MVSWRFWFLACWSFAFVVLMLRGWSSQGELGKKVLGRCAVKQKGQVRRPNFFVEIFGFQKFVTT